MTNEELELYNKEVARLQRCIEKYERQIFKLKQISFTKNQMVTRFYRHAELSLREARHQIKHGHDLHKHYIDQKIP